VPPKALGSAIDIVDLPSGSLEAAAHLREADSSALVAALAPAHGFDNGSTSSGLPRPDMTAIPASCPDLTDLLVGELRFALKERGLSINGKRHALERRLTTALRTISGDLFDRCGYVAMCNIPIVDASGLESGTFLGKGAYLECLPHERAKATRADTIATAERAATVAISILAPRLAPGCRLQIAVGAKQPSLSSVVRQTFANESYAYLPMVDQPLYDLDGLLTGEFRPRGVQVALSYGASPMDDFSLVYSDSCKSGKRQLVLANDMSAHCVCIAIDDDFDHANWFAIGAKMILSGIFQPP
jgi:hypothetical protein